MVLGAQEDVGCPSAKAALARTRAVLGLEGQGGIFEELTPELEHVLVDQGGLRVLLRAFSVLIVDSGSTALMRTIAALKPEDGLGALTPHLVELLRFIDGSSFWSPTPHLDPVAAVHDMLVQCDAATTTGTVRRMLALELVRGPHGDVLVSAAGERVWLEAVLRGTRAALELPELRDLLERIQLDAPAVDRADTRDPSNAPRDIRVGREAFVLLARLLAQNLAAPNFEPAAMRDLVDRVLVSQVQDPAARAQLLELLDLILLVIDTRADVFPSVQALMRCMNEADADAAIPGLLYDWLTIDELSARELLDDVLDATAGSEANDLRLAAIELFAAFEARPALAADVARVVAALIDDDTGPVLIRTALRAQGRGVVSELAGLGGVARACRAPVPAP